MMAIVGSMPVTLANNTLADATQVMTDFNFVASQVNSNAAGLAQANNFVGAQTISGDIIATLTAIQTLTQKTLTDPVISNTGTSGRLSWYEESTWTPTVSFGGGTTGITYNINTVGSFTRIGNVVLFRGRLKLSNKGSSVGTAFLDGLPYTAAGLVSQVACSIEAINMTGLTGGLSASVIAGTTQVSVDQWGATGSASITNSNFTNSSDVYVAGHYIV